MTSGLLRKAVVLITPAILLIIASACIPYIAGLPQAKYELVASVPYLAAITGMLLAIHFHRGRPFFALTLILLFYWASRAYLLAHPQGVAAHSIFNGLSLFIPFNLMLITFMREKGIVTTAGRLRMVFFMLQLYLFLFLHSKQVLVSLPYLATGQTTVALLGKLSFSQIAFILFGIELAAITVCAVIRQAPIDSGLFGATVSFFIACNWMGSPNILATFSSSAAIIIAISILQDSYNLAFRDELTGIPSRRALNEELHGIGRSYAIAMVDIDHFKKFNDTYGHDVGDQVLRLVAKKLQNVGGGGKAYRYGGEEFTILFPKKGAKEALTHLEAIRKEVEEYRLVIRNDGRPASKRQGKSLRGKSDGGSFTHVTVSIGVADSGAGDMTKQDVIKTADKALYKAKSRGRNQVCT